MSLPYQVSWPPRTAPIKGITCYPPLACAIDAPSLDKQTLEAVNQEFAKSFTFNSSDSDLEAQMTAAFNELQIDWRRFVIAQIALLIITAALVIKLKDRQR